MQINKAILLRYWLIDGPAIACKLQAHKQTYKQTNQQTKDLYNRRLSNNMKCEGVPCGGLVYHPGESTLSKSLLHFETGQKRPPDSPLGYNNQINTRSLIGQSAMVYCASKLMEKLRLRLVIYEFFSCFTNIPRGLSAYKP